MEIKFINGISVKDTAYSLLVRQYENASSLFNKVSFVMTGKVEDI